MIIKGFLKKELIESFRNPVLMFALLFMPLVQAILTSYTISNEAVNLKIALLAEPNDFLMQRIYDRAIASGFFIPVKIAPNQDPVEFIRRGHANAVLVAPKGGLSRNIYRQENSNFQHLMDSSNVIISQALSGYVKSITQRVITEEFEGRNLVSSQIPTIKFDTRILFNPELNTKFYILPAIMSMVVMMTVVSIVCTSFSREKESGTMETLIAAPILKRHIIIGKIVPAIMIAFLNFFMIWMIGIFLFHLPFRGAFWMLVTTFFTFAFSISMLGLLLSTFCRDQQQAMLALMMCLFIFMMLSGMMCPIENMPIVLKILANANPLAHFIFLSRNIILKGCDLTYFFQHLLPIITFGFLIGILGVKRLKQTL